MKNRDSVGHSAFDTIFHWYNNHKNDLLTHISVPATQYVQAFFKNYLTVITFLEINLLKCKVAKHWSQEFFQHQTEHDTMTPHTKIFSYAACRPYNWFLRCFLSLLEEFTGSLSITLPNSLQLVSSADLCIPQNISH